MQHYPVEHVLLGAQGHVEHGRHDAPEQGERVEAGMYKFGYSEQFVADQRFDHQLFHPGCADEGVKELRPKAGRVAVSPNIRDGVVGYDPGEDGGGGAVLESERRVSAVVVRLETVDRRHPVE